jgi:hypothetical protein
MPEDAAIAGLLCALVVGLPVGTLIGAVLLLAAVALYNKMAGGASSCSSVPEPGIRKALWIAYETTVAQIIVSFLIGGLAGTPGQGADGVAQFISFPVSFLIMAGILSTKLPTTFGRAILVTLCYMLVGLLVVAVLVVIAVLVLGVVLAGAEHVYGLP